MYPKSIDEAIVDLSTWRHVYKEPLKLAKKIKQRICKEAGDYLKRSIGLAPNAFFAKLATDLQKPDGLVTIFPENIDAVLSKIQLTDLLEIAQGFSAQLSGNKNSARTPLFSPGKLHAVLHNVVGIYWHK